FVAHNGGGAPLSEQNLIGWGETGSLALVAARVDLVAGRRAEAVRRTTDLLTLARDQLHVGFALYDLLGATLATACCGSWTDEAIVLLPADARRALAGALQRFDAAVPPALATLRIETPVLLGNLLANPDAVDVRPAHVLA